MVEFFFFWGGAPKKITSKLYIHYNVLMHVFLKV